MNKKRTILSIVLLMFLLGCSTTQMFATPMTIPPAEVIPGYNSEGDFQVLICGTITDETYTTLAATVTAMTVENFKKVVITINSSGGLVTSSLSVVSLVEDLKAKGIEVITESYGLTMSGAFLVYISGSKRVSSKYSAFMIHGPRLLEEEGVRTEMETEEEKDFYNIEINYMKDIVKKYTKLTDEQIDKYMEGEKFFTVEEAKEAGIVDVIK